jgi:hypothetical protein
MRFKTKNYKSVFSQIFILIIVAATTATAQVASAFQFIAPKEVSDLQLSVDMADLLAQKKTNNYLPATLTAHDGTVMTAEVRARGKFRRKICEVPPLKVKFPKKSLRALGLDTFNEVRLTLPCLDNPEAEANVIREYLAYKMYERLNPAMHVKARLIRLKIHDTHVEKTQKAVYALLLEHEEELVARLGGGTVETAYNLLPNQLDESTLALNAMFQYLIGNTDWDVQMVRNVYPYKPQNTELHYIIPYDFDFSGLVSAPYARATAEKGVRTVRDRVLMADGIPAAALEAARKKILDARDDIFALCDYGRLDEVHQADCRQYIQRFFENVTVGKPVPTMIEDLRD